MPRAFIYSMTTASKLMAAVAVSISMAAATQANAGEPLGAGYRDAPRPDLAAAVGGALAAAVLQLIPQATAALAAKLRSEASAPSPPPPPVVVAQAGRSPPSNDVLDDIEGNSRGITRQEVEAALIDWCATHADAPLCVKLRVASPPPPSPPGPVPRYAPPPPPYYRGYSAPVVRYYRPGRFRTWNGCQDGWTVQTDSASLTEVIRACAHRSPSHVRFRANRTLNLHGRSAAFDPKPTLRLQALTPYWATCRVQKSGRRTPNGWGIKRA
jgi:hypothetical protein